MAKIYLVVTLIINGAAVSGDSIDGWHRMQMADMPACERAADRGNARGVTLKGVDRIVMHCEKSVG